MEREREKKSALKVGSSAGRASVCRIKEPVQFKFQRSHLADGGLLMPRKECEVSKQSWEIGSN